MKRIENWDQIQEAGSNLKIEKGAYIIRITDVEDFATNEYLKLSFDFFEGKYKDAAINYKRQHGEWPRAATTIRSYKESAHSFFKGFITAIEKSNAKTNYRWNWDEKTLIGKYAVAVFGEVEFKRKDGILDVQTQCVEIRSIEALRNNEIVIPDLRQYKGKDRDELVDNTADRTAGTIYEISDDDLPF